MPYLGSLVSCWWCWWCCGDGGWWCDLEPEFGRWIPIRAMPNSVGVPPTTEGRFRRTELDRRMCLSPDLDTFVGVVSRVWLEQTEHVSECNRERNGTRHGSATVLKEDSTDLLSLPGVSLFVDIGSGWKQSRWMELIADFMFVGRFSHASSLHIVQLLRRFCKRIGM